MAPPQMAEEPLLGEENNLHLRRYSQSHVVSFSSAKDSLTVPYSRGRSYSASAAHGSLAAQLIASVNEKIKQETSYYEDASFMEYMDETWDTAKALLLGSKRLLLIEELPKDRQENEYVLSGYRFYRNTTDCLRSLFKLHNETMNIWSHLLGFLFFSYLSVSIFQVFLNYLFLYKNKIKGTNPSFLFSASSLKPPVGIYSYLRRFVWPR